MIFTEDDASGGRTALRRFSRSRYKHIATTKYLITLKYASELQIYNNITLLVRSLGKFQIPSAKPKSAELAPALVAEGHQMSCGVESKSST